METIPIAGYPLSAIDGVTIQQIVTYILEDCRVKERQLVHVVKVSVWSVENIIHDHIHMVNMSAGWFLRLLTPLQKQERVMCTKALLTMYQDNVEDFFDRLITQNETLVHHYDPETKAQS